MCFEVKIGHFAFLNGRRKSIKNYLCYSLGIMDPKSSTADFRQSGLIVFAIMEYRDLCLAGVS